MSAVLVAVALYALAAVVWPALYRPAPVPAHMLLGGNAWWNFAFRGALVAAYDVKLVAVGGVVGMAWAFGGTSAALISGGALALVLAGLGYVGQLEPRSCAAPLRDEAVFLAWACAVAAAMGLWTENLGIPGLASAVGGGVALVVAALVGLAVGFLRTWGDNPSFVVMRRPDFRVLGDNPDAHTVICRVRVEGRGLRVELPRIAEGPVTFAVYSSRLKALRKVAWDELRGPLEAREVATIQLGASGDADFHLELEPGDYLLSVRNYRPFDRSGLPRVEVLR